MSNILKNETGSLQPNYQEDFKTVSQLIHDSRIEAQRRVNETLIKLYWDIGSFIHDRVKTMGWGRSTVEKLSSYILDNEPGIRGFSARNIWRMKQFFETYENNEKLSAALTEINWSNHLHILTKTQSIEEKEFYLTLASKHYYPEREFARLIDSGVFERTMIANQKLSAALTEFPVDTKNVFKDSYLFEFTGLHNVPNYKEFDLKRRLLNNLKTFLMELGPDFAFVATETA